ncbi:MAG: hypothetical protein AAB605_00525 [Patescibacteria group bacterium]
MIFEKNIFGLRSVRVVLDDDEAMRAAKSKRYARLEIISHTKLDFPGFIVQEKQTGLIDLRGSPEEVLATFNKTTRNEIARTFADPQFNFRTFTELPDDIHALYEEFERKLGHDTPFSKEALKGCIAFGAYYERELLAGIYVFPSAPIARIRAIFSRRSEHSHLVSFASRRLVYEICRWGIAEGRSAIDLARVITEEGSNFKMSFNPRIIPEYVYRRASSVYAFLERVRILARKLLHV